MAAMKNLFPSPFIYSQNPGPDRRHKIHTAVRGPPTHPLEMTIG